MRTSLTQFPRHFCSRATDYCQACSGTSSSSIQSHVPAEDSATRYSITARLYCDHQSRALTAAQTLMSLVTGIRTTVNCAGEAGLSGKKKTKRFARVSVSRRSSLVQVISLY